MSVFHSPEFQELQELVAKLCTRVSALEADVLEQEARVKALEEALLAERRLASLRAALEAGPHLPGGE